MSSQPKALKESNRAALIRVVKTPLGFYVLMALIVEAALGGLAASTAGQIQLVSLYGLLFIIVALIAVVSLLAYWKPDALVGSSPAMRQVQDFCGLIVGDWWERITPDKLAALSFVEMRIDSSTGSIRMAGRAYARDGKLAANWETEATCIRASEAKVFYYWKGHIPTRPNERYEGFGELTFHESNGRLDRGDGLFSDRSLSNLKATTMKSAVLRRCTEQESRVLIAGESKPISELIRRVADSMR